MHTCPVCKDFQGVKIEDGPVADSISVGCPKCGSYHLSGSTRAVLSGKQIEGRRHLLTAVLRESSDEGKPIFVRSTDIEKLIESARVPSDPLALADSLLARLAKRASTLSTPIPIKSDQDYPLVFGTSAADLDYFVDYLREAGFLELKPHSGAPHRISLKGWEHIHRFRQEKGQSSHAFVAMWFDASLDDAWQTGFAPGLRDAGYDPIRVDLLHHNGKICDRILAEVRGSAFVVADFTGNRGGVYFEAGFAMGLGMPVIWTCRDEVKDLHFDTRQFNHIVWQEPEDLRQKLFDRVVGTIGQGPD